jgi:hypothetical protein
MIADEFDLINLNECFTDGTKIKANASIHHAYSYGKAIEKREKILKEIKTFEEILANSDNSSNQPDLDISYELKLRYNKLAVLNKVIETIERKRKEEYDVEMKAYEDKMAAREQIENETGKKMRGKVPSPPKETPDDKEQYNLTDSESRVMPVSSNGFVQGYNCQACAEPKSMLVLGGYVTQNPNDKKEIKPILDELRKNEDFLGQPRALGADAGYFSDENVKACEEKGIEPYIPPGRIPHHLPLEEFLPPKALPESTTATSSTEKMRQKLDTKEVKEIYKKRKQVIEPVFGIIKETMKFRQFRRRGLPNANVEWKLVCMAYNIKMMFNKLSRTQPDILKQLVCQNP